ncbi:MAG: DVUA0089 family protein [Ideonella sp.]|nr:DVUA0089 family protein [Ideonella sp.]
MTVPVGGSVGFTSTGYSAGGIDPYFTLFRGIYSATATFVASNYIHALALGGDFTQTETLSAGDYTVAIGTFENLSFAENLGSGFRPTASSAWAAQATSVTARTCSL